MEDPAERIDYQGPHSEEDLDLFGRYRALVRIQVEDQSFYVPESNNTLRALQYLEMKAGALKMAWSTYCWNNTEGCCEMVYQLPGEPAQRGRACQLIVRPGLTILQLPKGGRLCPPEGS